MCFLSFITIYSQFYFFVTAVFVKVIYYHMSPGFSFYLIAFTLDFPSNFKAARQINHKSVSSYKNQTLFPVHSVAINGRQKKVFDI